MAFQVEAVLDENPDFFKDYFIRKGSRHMIDSWLVAHSLPPGHCLPISPKSGSSTPHTRYGYLSRPYYKKEEPVIKLKDAYNIKMFQVPLYRLQVHSVWGCHTYKENQCPGDDTSIHTI